MSELIGGHATPAGTNNYRARFASRFEPGHFRDLDGRACSSIGIGTYLGDADDATDARYRRSIGAAVESGINVIDTAINYRCQRSERAAGAALRELFAKDSTLTRDQLIVATKGGFLPYDGARPRNARAYYDETYVRPGTMRWEDVVAGCHCMSPRYLRDQLARSRKNLGLATVDIYYLHNLEMQLDEIPRAQFQERVRAAFTALEDARRAGELVVYGTATWSGYRAPQGEPGRLELDELLALARDAGGESHGFRVVQLPLNISMLEAKTTGFLEKARGKVYVMASASIAQGKLSREEIRRSIQLVRETPGVGTALIGMKDPAHVAENIQAAVI